MSSPASGTVTFLFTDIEGSTSLARQYPADLPALLARHHGHVFQITGDAFCAAFHTVGDAFNWQTTSTHKRQRFPYSETN